MKRRGHYRGSVARSYERSRRGSLWDKEQAAIQGAVRSWEPGESVLDVPVGTGRFLSIYADRDLEVTGVDVSKDMLAEARKKGTDATLQVGDVFDLSFPDGAFDRVVCFRLLNWMDLDEAGQALCEISRVTDGTVYASVTVLIGRPRRSTARIIHDPDAFMETVEKAGLTVEGVGVLREHRSHRYQVVTAR